MADACPVLSPEERKAAEILDRAQRAMRERVHAAGLDPAPAASSGATTRIGGQP